MFKLLSTKLNKFKATILRKKNAASTAAITLGITLLSSFKAFAIDTNGTLSGSDTQVQGMMVAATKKILFALGGGCITIALGIVALKMIMAHKREETRTEAIASIGWILGGAVIIGGILIIAGFLWKGVAGGQ